MRLALVLVCACSAPSQPPAATPVLPDVPFALLDPVSASDQRARFMEERVVPVMAPLFRAHDARRYAAFDCRTCHGDSRDFTMPNAALTKLSSKNDPIAVEWMTKTITPAMAALVDDPAITCTHCHVRDFE